MKDFKNKIIFIFEILKKSHLMDFLTVFKAGILVKFSKLVLLFEKNSYGIEILIKHEKINLNLNLNHKHYFISFIIHAYTYFWFKIRRQMFSWVSLILKIF